VHENGSCILPRTPSTPFYWKYKVKMSYNWTTQWAICSAKSYHFVNTQVCHGFVYDEKTKLSLLTFLCLVQSRLARDLMFFYFRLSFYLSIRVLPELWTWYFGNKWTGFAVSRHQVIYRQGHETVIFGGWGGQRSRSHDATVRLGGISLDPFDRVVFLVLKYGSMILSFCSLLLSGMLTV